MQVFTRELAAVHAASGQERRELFYVLAKRVAGRLDTVIYHQLDRDQGVGVWDVIARCKEYVDLTADPSVCTLIRIAERAAQHAYILATDVEPFSQLARQRDYEIKYDFFATRYTKDRHGKVISGESFLFSYGGKGEWQFAGPETDVKQAILLNLQSKAMQGDCEKRFEVAQKILQQHGLPVRLPRKYRVLNGQEHLVTLNMHTFSYDTEAYRGVEERFFELYWQSLDGRERHAVRQLLEIPEKNDLQELMEMDRRDVYWAILEVGATPR